MKYLIRTGEELMHIAMNVGKSCKSLIREFWALQGLRLIVESAILILRVNIALSEGEVHHTIHVITEFGDIIRGAEGGGAVVEIPRCCLRSAASSF